MYTIEINPTNNNMYAMIPNINFHNLFENLVFTKNINTMAKNIQPIDPNDIHILSIDEINNKRCATLLQLRSK